MRSTPVALGQLGFVARLEHFLAIDLVVAWRIYHLTMLGRMEPDAPCTVFFRDPEWKALYTWYHSTTCIPATPPTLREATRWIGIKGGFQGRKSDGNPGTEVLWHGLQKLDVAIEMYLIYHPDERAGLRVEYPPAHFAATAGYVLSRPSAVRVSLGGVKCVSCSATSFYLSIFS